MPKLLLTEVLYEKRKHGIKKVTSDPLSPFYNGKWFNALLTPRIERYIRFNYNFTTLRILTIVEMQVVRTYLCNIHKTLFVAIVLCIDFLFMATAACPFT